MRVSHILTRTTLDLDDALLAQAQALFPEGTPKTVLVDEALRRLVEQREPARTAARDPRIAGLVAAGLLKEPVVAGPLLRAPPSEITIEQLLSDLARDREDR